MPTALTPSEACLILKEMLQLFPIQPTSKVPAFLTPYLYLGSGDHAKDVRLMKSLGIKCVLNCAEAEVGTSHYKTLEADGIRCEGFCSSDVAGYNMRQHLFTALSTVDRVREEGGACFIHCVAGVNRSGFLAIAVLCEREKMSLIDAASYVKSKRGRVCTNVSFQEQLTMLAEEREWVLGSPP